MNRDVELELLFAATAIKNNFVDSDQLRRASGKFDQGSSCSIGDVLVEDGVIDRTQRSAIDEKVAEYLSHHNGDSCAGLAAFGQLPFPAGLFDGLLATCIHSNASQLEIESHSIKSSDVDTAIGQSLGKTPGRTSGESNGSKAGSPVEPLPTYGTVYTKNIESQATLATAVEPTKAPTRFRTERFHARGGLGEIFVATDLEVNREVALKEIQDQFADHADSRRMFVVEGAVTGSLEHPGVVPIYGMGRYEDGRPFYAMRFIRGESLKSAISELHEGGPLFSDRRDQSLALRQLLNRFNDVCNTIHYAHSRGVLHRDIKPDNIMLGPYGESLVVDWGLAALYRRDAQKPDEANYLTSNEKSLQFDSIALDEDSEEKIVGTLQYMPPEQAFGQQSRMQPTSDVFSLGATLYTLLTGQPMYTGRTVKQVLALAQQRDAVEPRQLNQKIPAPLNAIVEKATAKKPSDRYQTAQLLADDIESWLADEPVAARPEPLIERLRRWTRRHRTLVTTGVAALLMTLIGLGIFAALLTAKNAEVEAQRDKAEQNLTSARRAVRESFVKISEDERLKAEGLEQLRMDLLKSPEPYFTEFLAQNPDDLQLRFEQSQWRSLLADIVHNTESATEAISLHQQVQGNLASLADEFLADDSRVSSTDRQEFLKLRTNTELELAELYDLTGKYDLSIRSSRNAIEFSGTTVTGLVDIAKANPEKVDSADIDADEFRVRALTQLGRTQLFVGKISEGIKTLDRAIEMRAIAAALQPEKWRLQLNDSLVAKASALAGQGNVPAAVQAFAQALEQADSISINRQNDVVVAEFRARAMMEMAREIANSHRPTIALPHLEEARAITQRVVNRHPDNLQFQELMSSVVSAMSTCKLQAGMTADPEASRDELAEGAALYQRLIDKNPQIVMSRYQLLKVRLNLVLGDLQRGKSVDDVRQETEEILELIEKLATEHPQIPLIQVFLARARTTAANLALRSDGDSPIEQAEQACNEAALILDRLDKLEDAVDFVSTRADLQGVRAQIEMFRGDWQAAAEKEALRQQIMDRYPDVYNEIPFPGDRRADSLDSQAIHSFNAGKIEKGFECLDEAVRLRDKLVTDHPNEPVLRTSLAELLHSYGERLSEFQVENHEARSLKYYRRSLAVLKDIDVQSINTPQLQSMLFQLQFAAYASGTAGDAKLAAEYAEWACGIGTELNKRDPNADNQTLLLQAKTVLIGYKVDLGEDVQEAVESLHLTAATMVSEYRDSENAKEAAMRAYRMSAVHFHAKKKYEQARALLAELFRISEGSQQRSTIAINLADAEIRLGTWMAGAERSAGFLKAPDMVPLSYYNLAVNFSLAAAAANQDTKVDEQVRHSLQGWFQKNAIQALESARDAGYFKTENEMSLFNKDVALDAIRDTEAFRKFSESLKK